LSDLTLQQPATINHKALGIISDFKVLLVLDSKGLEFKPLLLQGRKPSIVQTASRKTMTATTTNTRIPAIPANFKQLDRAQEEVEPDKTSSARPWQEVRPSLYSWGCAVLGCLVHELNPPAYAAVAKVMLVIYSSAKRRREETK
jgi:hypothetical protein